MTEKKGWPLASGYLYGIASGIAVTVGVLYFANLGGVIALSSTAGDIPIAVLRWCHTNLGLSTIPFALVSVGFFYYLQQLLRLLAEREGNATAILAVEEKVDLCIHLFFGIGVIWTAIGMREALLASLGNMNAEIAAQKGAFYILTQLVEGGILLALSTTIFGGIGGYLMRVAKAWVAGGKLNAFAEDQLTSQHQEILDGLELIAAHLEHRNQGRDS